MRRKTLAATSAAVSATAVVGGLASSGARDPWYQRLRKPPFQPPPVAFPIAWTALYALIAVASAEALDGLEGEERAEFEQALAANLVLNAGWTWLFFRFHRLNLATVEAAVLAGSTADLIRRSRCRTGRVLLIPYALWTSFATILSSSIAWLNRGRKR